MEDPGGKYSEDAAPVTRPVMTQVDRALSGQPTAYPCCACDGLTIVMLAAAMVWRGDNIVGAVVAETMSGAQSIAFAALESLLAMAAVLVVVGFGALLIFGWRLA